MKTVSKSPERNTFQATKYLQRRAEEGKTPENNEDVAAMVDYYKSWNELKEEREADPDWQKDNLEWDLRTTDWILEKVRKEEHYAQNLYAAMCNNEFTKNDAWPILSKATWSCSWRYAGGIVADMRQEGDYIDWYCSGIRNTLSEEELREMTQEQIDRYNTIYKNYVSESVVTDEIREDLFKLGWLVIDENKE